MQFFKGQDDFTSIFFGFLFRKFLLSYVFFEVATCAQVHNHVDELAVLKETGGMQNKRMPKALKNFPFSVSILLHSIDNEVLFAQSLESEELAGLFSSDKEHGPEGT